jgi:hypothetical protein
VYVPHDTYIKTHLGGGAIMKRKTYDILREKGKTL